MGSRRQFADVFAAGRVPIVTFLLGNVVADAVLAGVRFFAGARFAAFFIGGTSGFV